MAVSDVGVRLVVEAQDSFIRALDGAKTAITELTDAAKGGFGFSEATTAADTLSTAIGHGLYDAVKMTAQFMMDMGKQAFNTVADFERTTQSITAMVAIEKSMGTTVKNVSKGIRELTKKENDERYKAVGTIKANAKAMEDLVAAQNKLKEADKEGKGSASLELNIWKIEDLQKKTEAAHATIDRLNSLEGSEFDIVSEEQINTIEDITEAMRLAKPEADEILDKLTRMALASPFERGPILNTMKQAQAFGFTSKEAMRMTETFIKFATVTGRNEGHITRLGYAMGQMNSQGKVMTRQLRQMNMAGLGMDQMAQAMGMSMEEFTAAVSKGKIPFDEFNDKLTEFISKKYTPAFNEINESFYGLKNAISDISKLSLAAFAEGTMEAGKQIMVEFVRPFTQGSALQAIQSFGDGIGKVLEPALTKVAELVKIGMEGFIKFSDLLAGGLPTKEEKLTADNAKELGKIQAELEAAMIKTAAAGTSESKAVMDAGAAYEWTKQRAITLKDELVLVQAEEKKLGQTVKDQTTLFDTEVKSLETLKKKHGEHSKEYKDALLLHKQTGDALKTATKQRDDYAAIVSKTTQADKDNTASLTTTKTALDKLKGSAAALNPEYEKLKNQKALLISSGSQEGETYQKIVARMKEMEDSTTNYVDNSMHLADTKVLGKELEEQLKKVGEESKVMGDKMGRGGDKPTFLDNFLTAFEKIIPAGGPVYIILKLLEDIFFKIKDKVDKAIDAVVNFGKKAKDQTGPLDAVAGVLRFIRDNFDEIWQVGTNVLGVIVGLGVFNRLAGYIKIAAGALGLFLTPLGFIVGAVGGLTIAYQKNVQGVKNFADNSGFILGRWGNTVKNIFDENREESKLFKSNWGTAVAGVKEIFEKGFVPGEGITKSVENMNRIDGEGFATIRRGLSGIFQQFDLFPAQADAVASLLVAPVEKINEIFNGITVAIKAGVIDKFVGFWKAKPGSAEAQVAADAIKDILMKLVPPGWHWVIVTAIELVTDLLHTLKWAFEGVQTVVLKLTASEGGLGKFNKFLNDNKQYLATAIELVGGLALAFYGLNSAMVSVAGVSLANVVTGIAPDNIQGIANMGRLGGGPVGGAAAGAAADGIGVGGMSLYQRLFGKGGNKELLGLLKNEGTDVAKLIQKLDKELGDLASNRYPDGAFFDSGKQLTALHMLEDKWLAASKLPWNAALTEGQYEALERYKDQNMKWVDEMSRVKPGDMNYDHLLEMHQAGETKLLDAKKAAIEQMKDINKKIELEEYAGKGAFGRWFSSIGEGFRTGLDKIKEFNKGVYDSISKAFSSVLGSIKGFGTAVYNGVSSAFTSMLGSIKSFGVQLINSDAAQWAKKLALDTIGWVKTTALAAWGLATTAATESASWVKRMAINAAGWVSKLAADAVGWVNSVMQSIGGWALHADIDAAAWIARKYAWVSGWFTMNLEQKIFWVQAGATAAAGWAQQKAIDAAGWVQKTAASWVGYAQDGLVWVAGAAWRQVSTFFGWVAVLGVEAWGWLSHYVLNFGGYLKDGLLWVAGAYRRLLITIYGWAKIIATEVAYWIVSFVLGVVWLAKKLFSLTLYWIGVGLLNTWGWIKWAATNLWGAIMSLGPLLMYAISATAALIGPWGIAIVIIAALIYAIVMNVEGFRDKIVEILTKVFAFLTDVVMTIVGSIITIAQNLYDTWKDRIVVFFNDVVVPAIEAVADMFNHLLEGIGFVIDILWSMWELFKLYVLPILEVAFTFVIDLVIGYLGLLFTAIGGIIRIAWTIIKTIGTLIYQFLEATGVIDYLKDMFKRLADYGSGPEFKQMVERVLSGADSMAGGIFKLINIINSAIEAFEYLGRAARNQKLLSDIPEFIEDLEHPGPVSARGQRPKYNMIVNPEYTAKLREIEDLQRRDDARDLFKKVQAQREKVQYEAVQVAYDPYNLNLSVKKEEKGFMAGLMAMFGGGGGAGIAAKLGLGMPEAPAGMDMAALMKGDFGITMPGSPGGVDPFAVGKAAAKDAENLKKWALETDVTGEGAQMRRDARNDASRRAAELTNNRRIAANEALFRRSAAYGEVGVDSSVRNVTINNQVNGVVQPRIGSVVTSLAGTSADAALRVTGGAVR